MCYNFATFGSFFQKIPKMCYNFATFGSFFQKIPKCAKTAIYITTDLKGNTKRYYLPSMFRRHSLNAVGIKDGSTFPPIPFHPKAHFFERMLLPTDVYFLCAMADC